MPVFAPEAPLARSFFSTSSARIPRNAQSRAMPAPLTPPPRMITSCSVRMDDAEVISAQPGVRERSRERGGERRAQVPCVREVVVLGVEERAGDADVPLLRELFEVH